LVPYLCSIDYIVGDAFDEGLVGTGTIAENGQLCDIRYMREKRTNRSERPCQPGIAIALPWGLPDIVSRFLERMRIPEASAVYAIATNGSLAGDPHIYVKRILARKNQRLSASFLVWMQENFIFRYPSYPKWLDKFGLKAADKKPQRLSTIFP
jgi:hypothetical protein